MKINVKTLQLSAAAMILLCLLAACGGRDAPSVEAAHDKPTIPADVALGIDYLYDFTFSERYDDQMTDDYALTMPEEADQVGDTFLLLEKYHNMLYQVREYIHNGDGVLPYMQKSYWYAFEAGDFVVGTDYYEPDSVEYITCLWSNIEGVKTNRGVAVGGSEEEVLAAYTDALYYLDKTSDETSGAEPDISEPNETYNCDFDYAYLWQPYEDNDIRDITFYIKSGRVAAIEVVKPYELRYAYGYDRDAGLEYADGRRASLG